MSAAPDARPASRSLPQRLASPIAAATILALLVPVLAAVAFPCVPVRAAEIVPPSLPDPDTWVPRQQAELRVLDKIGAQATPLVLKVGRGAAFHSLTVTLQACVVRPPELPPDAAAFLDIVDSHEGAPGFHGWMFSGEPGLGMLENPLYDVHLLSCQGGSNVPAPMVPTGARPPG